MWDTQGQGRYQEGHGDGLGHPTQLPVGNVGTCGDKGTHTEIGGRGKGHTDVETPRLISLL